MRRTQSHASSSGGKRLEPAVQTEIVGLLQVIRDVFGDDPPRNLDPIITYFVGALEDQRDRMLADLCGIDQPWDRRAWRDLRAAARKMNRQQLAAFWIASIAGKLPDDDFNRALDQARTCSKNEILDILEILLDPDAAGRFGKGPRES